MLFLRPNTTTYLLLTFKCRVRATPRQTAQAMVKASAPSASNCASCKPRKQTVSMRKKVRTNLPMAYSFRIPRLSRHASHVTLKCVNHSLRVHQHVLGVYCADMFACLGLHLMDKCLELVDRYRALPTLKRCLCSIELDQ